MKKLVMLSIIAVLALAQTRPKILDLKPPSSTSVVLFAYVNDAAGKPAFTNISLGSVFQLTPIPGGLRLDLLPLVPTLTWSVDTFNGGGLIFNLFNTPNVNSIPPIVTKNGIIQQGAIDYTMVGKVLTFLFPVATDDAIQVRYQF